MVYIGCWVVHYLLSGLTIFKRVKINHAFLVSLCLFSVLSVFRWNVGTDSGNYAVLFRSFSWETLFRAPVEPLFVSLCLIIRAILGTDKYTLNILSALFSALLFLVFNRSSEQQKKVLFCYVIPIFFFSYSMNIIRFGIAAVTFVYGWERYSNGKSDTWVSAFILLISSLLHVSIVYMLFMYVACFFKVFDGKKLGLLIAVGFLSCVLNAAHIQNRKEIYTSFDNQAISQSAGVARASLAVVLTVGMVYFLGTSAVGIGIFMSLNLGFIFIVMAGYKMVGLRLLDIYMFTIPLVFIFYFESIKSAINRKIETFLLPFSFVMCLLVYKDMYNSKDHSKTPFLPYKTVFSMNDR